jgi:hypothetical protein
MDSLLLLVLATLAAAVLANLAVAFGEDSRDGFVGRDGVRGRDHAVLE